MNQILLVYTNHFFHSQLSNLELQIIKSLYKFLYQFGSEYFPLQFIEVGSYEKDEFKREFEVDENLPFVDRRFLIRLFESCQLTKEGAYPCDFMHFIANTIIRMISFVNDSYVNEKIIDYSAIFYYSHIRKPGNCGVVSSLEIGTPYFFDFFVLLHSSIHYIYYSIIKSCRSLLSM